MMKKTRITKKNQSKLPAPRLKKREAIPLWQTRFFDYLKTGKSDPGLFFVRGKNRAERKRRADIYRLDCPKRIYTALQPDFPGLIRALGARKFADLTRQFAATIPSTRASLYEVSDDFVAFLKKQKHTPVLQRQARRDLAKTKAQLAAIESRAQCALSEHTMLKLAAHCQPADGVIYYRVSRDHRLRRRRLGPAQAAAIELLAKGATVIDLSSVLERHAVPHSKAKKWFEEWTRDGLIH